jgi:hypothetical protein
VKEEALSNASTITTVAELGPEILEAAGLSPDAEVVVRRTEEGVVIQEIDPDQAWYWTPEFQTGERVAEAEENAGHGRRALSAEEFEAALERQAADDSAP